MTDWVIEKLQRQLEHARLIGDKAAVVMLTARIEAEKIARLSELEKRWLWGDR